VLPLLGPFTSMKALKPSMIQSLGEHAQHEPGVRAAGWLMRAAPMSMNGTPMLAIFFARKLCFAEAPGATAVKKLCRPVMVVVAYILG
jgi:hypothetical protein